MAMILASYPMWCFMSYHYLMSRFAMKSNFTNVKLLCFIMLAKMCPHRLKCTRKCMVAGLHWIHWGSLQHSLNHSFSYWWRAVQMSILHCFQILITFSLHTTADSVRVNVQLDITLVILQLENIHHSQSVRFVSVLEKQICTSVQQTEI